MAVRLNRCQIYMAGDKILSSAGFEKLTSALRPSTRHHSLDILTIVGATVSLEADTETLRSCAAGSGRTGV